MARPVTLLMVFFVSFNLFAGAIQHTGFDKTLGIDAEVGGDDEINERTQEAHNISTGTSLGNTLFGMYNVLADGLSTVFGAIFPGLNMLARIPHYPEWLNAFILGPLFSVWMFVGTASFLKGFDL